MPKHFERELRTSEGLKTGKARSEKNRSYWRKYWWIIALMLVVTVSAQWLSSFVFTGWPGFILGIALSVISFILGFYGIEKVLEKEIQYSE